MIVEVVAIYFVMLVILKKTLFPRVSTYAIVVLTCVLTVLMAAAAGGAGQSKGNGAEFFAEEAGGHGGHGGESLKYLTGLQQDQQDKNAAGTAFTYPPIPTPPTPESQAPAPAPQSKLTTDTVALNNALTEDVDVIEKSLKSVSSSTTGTRLVFYYSVYSPISYAPSSIFWNNLVDSKSALQFSDIPTKSAGDLVLLHGVPLGGTSLSGPPCSDLGFSAKDQYSVFMQLRFSKTIATSKPSDVLSFFSASASSPSTSGMIMRISEVNNTATAIPTARITFLMSNNLSRSLVCAVNGLQDIPFHEETSYVFVIIKTTSRLKVYMCSGNRKEPVVVLNAEDLQPSDEFVNLPMTINSTKNADAKLMAFGGYNTGLEHNDVVTVCNYLFAREREAFDPDYVQALKKIKMLEEKYDSATKCPFKAGGKKEVCDACPDIKNWAAFDEIAMASSGCLSLIAEHCASGPDARKTGVCACWDARNPKFEGVACTNIRAAFKGEALHDLKSLSESAISEVKFIYGDRVCPNPPSYTSPTPPEEATETSKQEGGKGVTSAAAAGPMMSHEMPEFAAPPAAAPPAPNKRHMHTHAHKHPGSRHAHTHKHSHKRPHAVGKKELGLVDRFFSWIDSIF